MQACFILFFLRFYLFERERENTQWGGAEGEREILVLCPFRCFSHYVGKKVHLRQIK